MDLEDLNMNYIHLGYISLKTIIILIIHRVPKVLTFDINNLLLNIARCSLHVTKRFNN